MSNTGLFSSICGLGNQMIGRGSARTQTRTALHTRRRSPRPASMDDSSAVLASDQARMPAVRFLSVWSFDGLK